LYLKKTSTFKVFVTFFFAVFSINEVNVGLIIYKSIGTLLPTDFDVQER